MRIGLLFEYGTLNGGEYSMLAALDHADRQRCEFVVFAPENSLLSQEITNREFTLENLALRDSRGKRLSQEVLQRQLSQWIDSHHLDLLHANSLTMGRHLGAIASQLKVPTSCHLRDIMSLSSASIRDLNQHTSLFTVSEATRSYHIQQGLDAGKVKTVYNGVDCEAFCPRTPTGRLLRELNLPSHVQLAGTIGQICLRKAHNDLAFAAVLLKDRCPGLHFVIVGERHSTKQESIEFETALTSTFTEAGMGHRLHKLGYRNDIASILNELDLLLHPARQEPLGRVLLEAAASGTPIVATDVGGTPEILSSGTSALLVPPAQPEQLANAVQKIVEAPALGMDLAGHARCSILERFEIHTRSEALLQAWEQIELTSNSK